MHYFLQRTKGSSLQILVSYLSKRQLRKCELSTQLGSLGSFHYWCPLYPHYRKYYNFKIGDDKFMHLFTVLLSGAGLVSFNIRSLGGQISYFQSLSVLGYCIFPMFFTTIILKILDLFAIKYMSVNMISLTIATLWSTMCNNLKI